MEMTLYEFILGLVGTFFVFVPALGALIYMLFKELKKAEQERNEQALFRQNLLNCLNHIADNIDWTCSAIINSKDEEEE